MNQDNSDNPSWDKVLFLRLSNRSFTIRKLKLILFKKPVKLTFFKVENVKILLSCTQEFIEYFSMYYFPETSLLKSRSQCFNWENFCFSNFKSIRKIVNTLT